MKTLRLAFLTLLLLIFLPFSLSAQQSAAKAGLAKGEKAGLDFSGDVRVRYELNDSQYANTPDQTEQPNRRRGALRLRTGFEYSVNDMIKTGARVVTGSADDPNSTDVTLGSFNNDLEISADLAYINFNLMGLSLYGGKFNNLFIKTDLVWDGDVNPQGAAAMYKTPDMGGLNASISGIHFIIEEDSKDTDSSMNGGQISLSYKIPETLVFTLAGSYYDYGITTDPFSNDVGSGDTLSNRTADTDGDGDDDRYVSDYDLVEGYMSVEYLGLGSRLPIKLTGNYVLNLGADEYADILGVEKTEEDTGFAIDLFVGRMKEVNDFRVHYGYSQTDADAVFAAFSNNNTEISSNYKQHTLELDYVVLPDTFLNITAYYYKYNKFVPGAEDKDKYITRVRLNAMVKF